jgi:hypothetical protein
MHLNQFRKSELTKRTVQKITVANSLWWKRFKKIQRNFPLKISKRKLIRIFCSFASKQWTLFDIN